MSKKTNIKKSVMNKISNKEIVMKPKVYFVIGSIITFMGVVLSMITSVFFVNLMSFLLRRHGPMGSIRLNQLLTTFPWYAPIIALVSLLVGIKLLKHYDFSYKKNFILIVIGLISSLMITNYIINFTKLNNLWLNNRPMKRMMKKYLDKSITPINREYRYRIH